ncbi:MAG TPA: EF-hand domain-containing protein [Planctomycetota bacterium]|nr:EF-hand domain-containing protein [Planctomycetota bacterium]HRR79207.1 EF-hand domain-containing protein [Planctomycetota bacterium]HRT94232.1 EF-hand domain-containing protein [Planctomycetota bacterium]
MKKLALIAALVCLSLPALAGDDANPPPAPGKGLRGAVREKVREKARERVLGKFDQDGDGKLEPEERAAAREALVNRLMQRFDKDGDGKLSREELSEALVALRGRLEQARQHRAGKGANAHAGPKL